MDNLHKLFNVNSSKMVIPNNTDITITISSGVQCRTASCITIQYSTAMPMTPSVFVLLFLYYNSGGNRLSGEIRLLELSFKGE